MTALTNQEKQAAFKARMRSAGYLQLQVWVHADDKEKIRRYAVDLRGARLDKDAGDNSLG